MQTRRKLFCIITWSPKEGVRLFPKLLPVEMNIQWIDEKGNFYDYWWLRNPLWTLLDKLRIRRILQTLGFSDHLFDLLDFELRKEAIRIFSPEGELLEVIVLPALPRPSSKEKFKYGQLIKINAQGIYMEVVRINKEKEYYLNEVKEYHIVRIVKKKRWQVWWEKLTRKGNLFPPKG